TWLPDDGSLNTTTGSSVTATPLAQTIYTVVGSTGTCTNSATVTVDVAVPFNITAAAADVCAGGTSTLTSTVSNSIYTDVSSIAYSPESMSGETVIDEGEYTDLDDGMVTVELPFTFYFYGKPKTSVQITTNGYIAFSGTTVYYSSYEFPD